MIKTITPLGGYSSRRGFALVVTLSLMILLTVVAVGLLTLSSISLRATSQGAAQAAARTNARLGLMLAIGEIQKALGPDQRISANASSFNPSAQHPNLVGAWNSLGWNGPAGDAPSPSQKAENFRTWLVSTRSIRAGENFDFPNPAGHADSVWLSNPATTGTLSSGTTKQRAERVPLTVGSGRGGLAWMVSDNSTKAPLNIPTNNSVQLAENIANRTSASAPRPDVLDQAFSNIKAPGNLISMQTAVLAIGKENSQQIDARAQSLTSSSNGLLTNPISGGLKTDLTPLLEGSANLSSALGAATPYFAASDGAPTWNFLRSHYQLYRRVTSPQTGFPRFRLSGADLSPPPSGIQASPAREVLLPVIAKLQIIFSLVSHHVHISERVRAFNELPVVPPPQEPIRGVERHAVPHLVYDPVITLYNPYDVELDLTQLRIRVSDPPVGFQFQKHDLQARSNPWYRDEFSTGDFHGLARFQIDNERNANARKTFTLFLRNKNAAGTPGGNVILLPGEVKVFSPWVEKDWTWGLETSGGYTPRAFFDWNVSQKLGNEDKRTSNTRGVETIPGLDFRAGFQTDHLSYQNNRPASSRYPWENNQNLGAGWLSMKLSDDVTVNAKPQRCVVDPSLPDFRVDILAGVDPDPARDILRTYEFRLGDVATEMSTTSSPSKTISRRFRNGDILQTPADKTPGGKSPFAIFTMSAKTTKDTRDDSKAWLYNNMVTEGGSHDSRRIGNAAQSYDIRLQEVQDFTVFPGVEYDDATQRGFFGAIANANRGVSIVPMYRVPLTPAASLGDWIASNLITTSHFPRVNYALGNSFSHPLVPSDRIHAVSPMASNSKMLDHSYLMNAAMWDRYYFSSASNYTAPAFSPTRGKAAVLSDFFSGKRPMLNSRLMPYLGGDSSPQTLASKFGSYTDVNFSRKFAGNALIQGAFNVNSDSVDAWRAVLSSLRDANVVGYGNLVHQLAEKTAFVRVGMPVAGPSDDANPGNSVNALGQIRWAGFRSLTDEQIKNLATAIVGQIRARAAEDKAPSLCLGDFINRRIGSSSSLHALKGILQTAIDESGINDPRWIQNDSNQINASALAQNRVVGLGNIPALDGATVEGAAPMLTQGDLLTGLAPIITARGDTFTIRSYGEARDAGGTTVTARAWCEAVVQRVPEYVDPVNEPDALPTAVSLINQTFGRQFRISSFRWLNASEI
jgi:hypothetical protein